MNASCEALDPQLAERIMLRSAAGSGDIWGLSSGHRGAISPRSMNQLAKRNENE